MTFAAIVAQTLGMASTGDNRPNWFARWIRGATDYYRTQKTRAAIAERECQHDGSEPMCEGCIRDHAGW